LTEAQQVESAEIIVAFWQYCENHVAARRAERGDDVTSDLLDLADAKPEQLNDFDIVNMVYSMALAGHETTCNTIGNGMRALLGNRDQWQRLIDDPSAIPNAVEEILRYESSQVSWRRITTRPTVLGGYELPAGTQVFLNFASAHREPELFEQPERFDIHRANANRNIAFGKGIHYCLGANLAKLEARIVVQALAQRIPTLALTEGQAITHFPNITFRGPERLELTWSTT
jgi:hypothetical protein